MQRVGEFVDEFCDVFFVSRIDLLPIDHNPGSLRVTQDRKDTLDKLILPLRGPVRQVFYRFGLPRVAEKICQQRHKGDALVPGQL